MVERSYHWVATVCQVYSATSACVLKSMLTMRVLGESSICVNCRQDVASLNSQLKVATMSSKGGDKAKQLLQREFEKLQKKQSETDAKLRAAAVEKQQVWFILKSIRQSATLSTVICWWRGEHYSITQCPWYCVSDCVCPAPEPLLYISVSL